MADSDQYCISSVFSVDSRDSQSGYGPIGKSFGNVRGFNRDHFVCTCISTGTESGFTESDFFEIYKYCIHLRDTGDFEYVDRRDSPSYIYGSDAIWELQNGNG